MRFANRIERGGDWESVRTEWQLVDDVWVPACVFAWMSDARNWKLTRIDLQWHSVNRPIDARVFDERSLSLAPGDQVSRLVSETESVLEKVIGQPTIEEFQRQALRRPPPAAGAPRLVLVIVNVAVLLLLAGLYVYRRNRRSSSRQEL